MLRHVVMREGALFYAVLCRDMIYCGSLSFELYICGLQRVSVSAHSVSVEGQTACPL